MDRIPRPRDRHRPVFAVAGRHRQSGGARSDRHLGAGGRCETCCASQTPGPRHPGQRASRPLFISVGPYRRGLRCRRRHDGHHAPAGATIIGAAVGTSLGFLAAHFRGLVEQAVLALVDFSASLPFLILALAVLAFFGNSLGLLVCLLGLHAWERYARIARGLALAAGAQGYAAAVRGLGASPWRIYGRHVLPNIASTLIVSMTLAFPEVILLESGLSFLGLGVQPPETSLGSMVGYGREYLTRAPWILLTPASVIVLTTLSVSLIGDWLRDGLDPTLR